MVALQTLGSVDMPGRGPRKLPSPRAYAAIIVTWGILQLIADAGGEAAGRATRAMAWVIVLVGMVLGPFGAAAAGFLNKTATALTQPTAGNTATTPYGPGTVPYGPGTTPYPTASVPYIKYSR
jgi:hypothetical protein